MKLNIEVKYRLTLILEQVTYTDDKPVYFKETDHWFVSEHDMESEAYHEADELLVPYEKAKEENKDE